MQEGALRVITTDIFDFKLKLTKWINPTLSTYALSSIVPVVRSVRTLSWLYFIARSGPACSIRAAPNPHMPLPGRRLADASPSRSSGEQAMLKNAGVQMQGSDLYLAPNFNLTKWISHRQTFQKPVRLVNFEKSCDREENLWIP